MSSEVAIRVDGVSKCYQVYEKPSDRLKQMLFGRSKQYYREFWALRDVSFEVRRGETLGVVGRNGSGKSTLLQLICGTLTPTAGRVQANKRIAALLELGAGFNPEFTGRENVYINAALLGMSKAQVDEQMQAILDFAEIGDFVDQPVRTYSSGMFTRLAFSVAIAVRPEILVVDEALSVGDVFFQQKCFAKIRELQKSGTTLLFVSHDPSSIKLLCDRAILLDGGNLVSMGDSNTVINDYVRTLSSPGKTMPVVGAALGIGERASSEYRYGDGGAAILKGSIQLDGADTEVVPLNSHCEIVMKIRFSEQVLSPVAGFYIKDKRGMELYSGNTFYLESPIGERHPGETLEIRFSQTMSLAPGEYTLAFGLSDYTNGISKPLDRRYDCAKFSVIADRVIIGLVDLASTVLIIEGSRSAQDTGCPVRDF